MHTVRASLLAGIAAVAVAGFCGGAQAQTVQRHVMTVRLPGGGIEQIEYTGNTPPVVSVDAAPAAVAAAFGSNSPFAEFDRISAEMDRRAAALFRETAALAANPNLFTETALGNLPAGAHSYTYVSTASGNGVCEQSVQITRTGNGPPQVVRHSSGNCGAGAGAMIGLPTAEPAPQAPHAIMTRAHPPAWHRPDMVLTKAEGAKPYTRMVKEIPVSER
jgi:hypothetical protein